jgi:hypothetical protein
MDRLRGSRVPETTALLRKLARSGSEVVQVHAALALIGRDDIAALQILEPLLERGSIAPAQALPVTSRTPAEGGGVHIVSIAYSGPQFLGSSIASVRDPAAVPALVRLMRAPDAVTRAGAASALRAIMHLYQLGGTWVPAWPDSVNVPAIIDTVADGLDDADEKVRYFSVCTLMEISGNPHYPSVPLFQSDESTYLATWKKWARERPLAQ